MYISAKLVEFALEAFPAASLEIEDQAEMFAIALFIVVVYAIASASSLSVAESSAP